MESLAFYLRRASKPETIVHDLARELLCGSLGIMVGAGASAGIGLPQWHELVVSCLRKERLNSLAAKIDANTPIEQLLDAMGSVHRKYSVRNRYLKVVHDALYVKGPPSIEKASPLIRAIACISMRSQRGSVSDILNYNFDSVLEQYFAEHGYVTQVIADVPRLTRGCDVRIWHPHGYLPSEPRLGVPSSRIIFDCDTADKFLASRNDPWKDVFHFLFGSKIFLAVGLSGRDPMTNVMLAAANEMETSKRPLGFWLHKRGSIEELVTAKIKARGFVPLAFDTYDDIALYLFDICQRSAPAVLT